jgi:hypothetical protein
MPKVVDLRREVTALARLLFMYAVRPLRALHAYVEIATTRVHLAMAQGFTKCVETQDIQQGCDLV